MKTSKTRLPKQTANNRNPTNQSKVIPIENGIKEKGTDTGNEKRKAMWWEKWPVFIAIISILIATSNIIYAHKSIEIANQALQKSDESNEIAKNSIKAAEKSAAAAEKANRLSAIANDMTKNSIKAAEKSAAAAEEAVKETREIQKIAIDANNITDTFNRIQYNIQRANLLKGGKELFESEKAVCCRKIIEIFEGYFYVMADISQEKIDQFLNWNLKSIPIEKEKGPTYLTNHPTDHLFLFRKSTK